MAKSSYIFAIDIGNTRIKWALFKAADEAFFIALLAKNLTVFDRHLQLQRMMTAHGNCLHDALETHEFPDAVLAESTHVVVSNVASKTLLNGVMTRIKAQNNVQLFTSTAFGCGIQNHYDNPAQFGSDRWAALIAAKHLQPSDCVVVNAGTAVTIDVLQTEFADASNEKLNRFSQTHTEADTHFLGGLILPGLRLMQTSLHQNTATLFAKSGESSAVQQYDFIQKNTKNAISKGAITAICSSILHVADKLTHQTNRPPSIIISGGDAASIVETLSHLAENQTEFTSKNTSRLTASAPIMIENLVLIGLYIALHASFNIIKTPSPNVL